MVHKELYEEVIDEIGTQTLARLGLNIFNVNTYAAYSASVTMTNDTARAYNRHKNNDKYFGQTFEELDSGMRNITDSLLNSGTKTYTTDTLADIKKTQEILRDGKNLANLNAEDRAKVEHILANYPDEVKDMDFSDSDSDLSKLAKKNHNTTDTVTIDKNGKVMQTSQLKVIKKTDDLLKDRYLEGDSAVDELKVPFEDYKKHKEELERLIAKGKDSNDPKVIEKARKAEIALEKLNANNVCNRLMCENPRITAVTTQAIVASGHVVQAGASDAIVAAMTTFASGLVCEVRNMYESRAIDSEISIMDRIKRLLQKVLDSFKGTFVRGAGFGIIDTAMGLLGQFFTSCVARVRTLWHNIRASAKSIYNGIYDYASGKITNIRELLSTILKSIFSAAWAVSAVALEQKLELMLPFGAILAPLFAIAVGAFAVVLTSRGIDMVLDSAFALFGQRDKAKMRAEEIAALVSAELPALLAEQAQLERIIAQTHRQRLIAFDMSFRDYQLACARAQSAETTRALNAINALWGKRLRVQTMDDVKAVLQNEHTGILQW
ncbi:MAG: hypothetical protein K2N69_02600 [Helicobacter sp.]|nr:hypothetical protein [Helicobacter sp.]